MEISEKAILAAAHQPSPYEDANTFEVPCQRCGEPVVLETPKTTDRGLNRMLIGMATKAAMHDDCVKRARAMIRQKEAAELLAMRAEHWKMLCDPLYRNSDVWLTTAEARKVNGSAIKRALEWNFGPKGLIMHGTISGSGKTTAAWCVLKKEHALGRFIVAMSHTEFSRQATMLAKDGTPETTRWRRTLEQCDILFIDDLGKSRFKTLDNTGKAGEELLFEILDYRVTQLKPCIFTSNTDGEGLKVAMSTERAEPFVRRLREFCKPINFDKGMV